MPIRCLLKATCVAAEILLAIVDPFIIAKIMDINAKSSAVQKNVISSYGGDEVMALAGYADGAGRAAATTRSECLRT